MRAQGTVEGRILLEEGEGAIPRGLPAAVDMSHVVDLVTPSAVSYYGHGDVRVLVVDTGTKENIVRCLEDRGAAVIRVPWNDQWDSYLDDVDALVLTNGPGDPGRLFDAVQLRRVERAMAMDKPILGICLGHQWLAQVAGATVFKMTYGHRSHNQPVVDLRTRRAYLTSQNHGYAVDVTHLDVLRQIGVKTALSRTASSPAEALDAARAIGFPVMLRAGYALGGMGSGVASSEAECLALAQRALVNAPHVLVEESLVGWKEIEYEVVRDADDNAITVCNMENVDPMGIHTGESMVVAPSQTLNDEEYQGLRDLSLRVIRHLGVVGECNIQYAVNPRTWDYRVIEVNARLSRSSALASKATGYPLAYIAAKLAVGYRLPELRNAITKTTSAFFEPALDYVVCKIPRWDLQKFEGADPTIGTEMKSVGEVMGIGRTFPEALQKAFRMLDIGVDGLDPYAFAFDHLESAIKTPSPRRMFAIARGLAEGMSIDDVARLTAIDPYFLGELVRIGDVGQEISILRDGGSIATASL